MRPTYPQLSGGSAFLRHLTALMQLQLPNLVGCPSKLDTNLRVFGRLPDLPAGITKLQLNHCYSVPSKRVSETGDRLVLSSRFVTLR